MKKLVLFILVSLTLLAVNIYGKTAVAEDVTEKNTVQFFCPAELEPLSTAWISEFMIQNSGIKIMTVTVDDPVSQMISEKDAAFAVITQTMASKMEELPLKVLIGRNAVIPVVSHNNQYLDKLNETGVSPEVLADLLGSSQNATWGSLLNKTDNQPLQLFTTSMARKTSTFQQLTSNNQKVTSIGLLKGQKVEEFMDENPNAILFCRLSEIIDKENGSFIDGIQVLPFDRNSNQQIDYMEMIFSNLDDFLRAVWIGKYPKLFSESLYLVSSEIPQQDSEFAFVEWILTLGQDQLNKQGYTSLTGSEIKDGLAMLYPNDELEATLSTASSRPILPFILIALAIIIILGIVVNFAFLRKRSSIASISDGLDYSGNINAGSINIPKGVWYDKTHTWLFREKNGEVRLGIDDFFQHLTGPLTRIELKKTGESVIKGEALLTIARDGKRLTIYSPITGTVTDSNLNLLDNPYAINADPFSLGWIYLVEPLNWKREMEFLKLADNYREWIKMEFARLKDVLTAILKPAQFESAVILQDGGAVKDGLLAEMEPQVWEEFQANFINTSK